MQNSEDIFPKGSTFYAVVKFYKNETGNITEFFGDAKSLEFLDIYKLTSTGEIIEDDWIKMIDHLGNIWAGTFNVSYGNVFYLIGDSIVSGGENFIYPEYTPEEIRKKFRQFATAMDLRKDYGEVRHYQVIGEYILQVIRGELAWDEISYMIPRFSGLTEKSILENKDESLQNYTESNAILSNIIKQMNVAYERISGHPILNDFCYGPVVFQINSREGRIPTISALMSQFRLIDSSSKNYDRNVKVATIVSAYFAKIGGYEFLKSYQNDIFEISCDQMGMPNFKISARPNSFTRESGFVYKFVELTTEDMLPIEISMAK